MDAEVFFYKLLLEDPVFQKKRAQWFEEGKKEAALDLWQRQVGKVLTSRFPTLVSVVPKIKHMRSVDDLERLFGELLDVPDESAALRLLDAVPLSEKVEDEAKVAVKAASRDIAWELACGLVDRDVEALRKLVVEVVEVRFPALVEFAQRKVVQINNPDDLYHLHRKLNLASDEDMACWMLNFSH